jgi:hypothetical protein
MENTNGHQKERWLRCLVDKGMFSDERAITYPPEGAALHSVFVPAEDVSGVPGEKGYVRVRVMSEAGAVWAILPTNYRDAVIVSERDLRETP